MKAFLLTISLMLLYAGTVPAQEKEMMYLCGVSEMEEMSEGDIERFQRLSTFPVPINSATRSRLASCGLFTPYQVAAIKDYLMNYGDILSSAELALVDGFGSAMAEAVKPFVSFAPVHGMGSKANNDTLIIRQEAMGRFAFKKKENDMGVPAASVKYSVETNKGINAAMAYRDDFSGNICYESGKGVTRVVLGDFYARFGQGLAVWDGFSISINSVSGLARRQSGFTPANTFSTGTARRGMGMTATFDSGRLGEADLSAFCSGITANSLSYGLHAGSYTGIVHSGMTFIKEGDRAMVSADAMTHFKKTDCFAEAAADLISGNLLAAAGVLYIPEYGRTYGAMVRHASSDALYAGMKTDVLEAFLSGEIKREKQTQTYKGSVIWNGKHFSDMLATKVKIAGRLKPKDKHPARAALTVESVLGEENRFLKFRGDMVACSGVSGLMYLEAGYRKSGIWPDIFMRAGLFSIGNWDNRIYVYERDCPGSFNIPAYYGKGWNLSVYSSWKHSFSRFCRLNLGLRMAYVGYTPDDDRPSAFETKIQCNIIL